MSVIGGKADMPLIAPIGRKWTHLRHDRIRTSTTRIEEKCDDKLKPSRLGAKEEDAAQGRLPPNEARAIAQTLIWVQSYFYGIQRRTIHHPRRIERERWSVAIHPAGAEMVRKVITGPREHAELEARTMINRWIERHPAAKIEAHHNSN
jgi:hypothetical protein